jgi:hypothetical protein
MGVATVDEGSLGDVLKYKDPRCEKRCENKGIRKDAMLLRRPTSSPCDIE